MKRASSSTPPRKSSGLGWVILIGAVALVWYAFSGDDPAQDRHEASTASLAAEDSYALRALVDNWPPILDIGNAPVRAPRLDVHNYFLLLDGSGSMAESRCSAGMQKIDAAVSALRAFVDAVPADANLGLAVFDERGIGERVALGLENRDAIRTAIGEVRVGGGTPLRSSIELAYDKLLLQGRSQQGYGEYHLVIVTDGQPDPKSEDPGRVVRRILAETPVVVHTVGFCIGTNHVLNQPGRSYYVAAESPQELSQGLEAVLAESAQFDISRFAD